MSFKVFYSWQSDLKNSTNRGFLESVVTKAIKSVNAEECFETDVAFDRDTLGLHGSPNITGAIFKKIEQCDLFVADISIVTGNSTDSERPSPNPNVLIELGYAISALGLDKIVLIYNEAYGTDESIPFDIRQNRRLSYYLDDSTTSEEKSKVKDEMHKTFIKILKGLLTRKNNVSILSTEQLNEMTLGEQIDTLLSQTSEWQEYLEDGEIGYFHSRFSEYKIKFYDPEIPNEESWEPWVEHHHTQTNLVRKDSEFSRVDRSSNLFGWGKCFDIYKNTTPIYQNGALIKLYKVRCPYPDILPTNGRYLIGTNKSESSHSRINYYVGAIACLLDRRWIHYTSEEPVGQAVFEVYNGVLRGKINTSRSDSSCLPMLVLDVDFASN